jgi:peroxiredoxin family protein
VPVYANDGKIRVQWVPGTALTIATPSAAAITAGTRVDTFVTKDGLTVPADQNNVDVAVLSDTFDAQVVGSFGGAIEMTGVRNDTADTFWDLCVYGTVGYIVVRRGLTSATAFASTQKVEVYPCQMHEPVPGQTGGNTVGQFTISFPVTAQPNLKAVCAA